MSGLGPTGYGTSTVAGQGGYRIIGHITVASPPPSASNVLIIGTQAFAELEHPPTLKFGITQEDVLLKSIGGTVSPQDLGSFHKDVTWSGNFRGSDSADRALVFKRMAYKGGEYVLKWQKERYIVKVHEFEYEYHTPFYGIYTITVEVIRDVAGQLKKATTTNIDQQTNTLGNNANGYATAIASADVTAAAGSVQALTQSVTANLPSINPIAQNQGNASFLSQITGAIRTASNYAKNTAPYALLTAGVLPNTHIFNSNMLVSTLSMIAANVSAGQPPNSMQVTGGTFSQICSRVYGDPTLWPTLAAANGFAGNSIPSGVLTTIRLLPLVGSKIA